MTFTGCTSDMKNHIFVYCHQCHAPTNKQKRLLKAALAVSGQQGAIYLTDVITSVLLGKFIETLSILLI